MLKNQIALVTGASRGLGEAIALALGREGAIVIGTATTTAGAEKVQASLRAAGISGDGLVMNVTDATQIDTGLTAVRAKFGEVTILVNNAGIARDNLAMRMKEEEWQDIIATNLTSVFRLCQAVLRPMTKARYGRIINITSVVALMGNAGQTNYGAAKAGIIGYSKSLAREVGSRNITVNCVAPGFIDTDMTKLLPEDLRQKLLMQIPLARLGRPEDVAAAVTFLASPGASYITGETLNVNGGMVMT